MKQKTIVLTGGGSAGHVTPNIALIEKLREQSWQTIYIGSKAGIEHQLIKPLDIDYYSIPVGKLRRYFSWQNFLDPFKVGLGIVKCCYLCFKLKPQVVFSKGGFVALPVVIGAWVNKIPIIVHESDLTPGLANKLCFPFAKIICITFAETKSYLKYPQKAVLTGSPIRPHLLQGDKQRGLTFAKLSTDKPVLLIICGSLGSKLINEIIRSALNELLKYFAIIHICGKGNIDQSLNNNSNYRQYEYISDELGDIFACSDLVISRSGANTLYELLTLQKPHILIPLSKLASRGDQIVNANYFKKIGMSIVLTEENLNPQTLLETVNNTYMNLGTIQNKLKEFKNLDSINIIYQTLTNLVKYY
ncbi:MAG: undecaprenyldiphospho-muramoylpentapeptide beta-N-acetylglucosaminyltransferase [Gammaproteobacteria bacterium RIFCSPHIGHO2_12_FULL_35_23]|nr:MAG: undecaprenyldiphospho-muramoylpentapeptide beta-N-acetylglucosaminyltransferase [Gammaproteobacteria bacterium RIFCSPHIGHO2_12_FULL_35_23]